MKDKNIYYIDHDFIVVILNAQSKNLNSTVDKSQKCLGNATGTLNIILLKSGIVPQEKVIKKNATT